MSTPFQPQTLRDFIGSFEGGVNQGASPLKLSPETMAGSANVTVRGDYATHRPCYVRRIVTYDKPATQTAVETGHFQGACNYLADDGSSSKLALISGRLFQFKITGNIVNCIEITINTGPQNTDRPQAWLWQSENYVIVQDGLSNPVFFNGTTTATRSNYSQPIKFSTTSSSDFLGGNGIPAVGSSDTINFTSATNLLVGDIVTFAGLGTFQVLVISGSTITLLNLTAAPVGGSAASGTVITWLHQGTQLPPGRMGTYGMQRNWFSLIDGKQFVAGDILGGPSGTAALNFRDSVLNITENLFLRGGGNFTVPGTVGAIRAMRFAATLDASLGQGPLQVLTDTTIFSCNAPVDRLTWQNLTNPILTESLISNGGMGQSSTVLANGDLLFRSIDGARSLILARRDFNTWGNVPISFEVSETLATDDPGLLIYSSGGVFDNRWLLTVGTTSDVQGVYFRGIVALNFDPLSSLRGKQPSVWDGLWTGMNVLQLTVGNVDEVERAFAFVLNTDPAHKRIEFWEILKTDAAIADNDGFNDIPITWRVDSPSLGFGVERSDHKYMQLSNGEIWVEDLQGTVTFQVQYKADQYPCWTDWHAWQTCQTADASDSQPGFLPRMGLGEPSGSPCDASTGRPNRNGFTFQTRTLIRGHCVLLGEFYEAQTQPQPRWAKMVCKALCPPP